VVAPDTIALEPDLPAGFDEPASDIGVPGGAPIEGRAAITPPPPVVEPPVPAKVRPGGQIRTPERVSYVGPAYPAVALAARVHGVVIIEATIDPSGRVQDARILRSASPLLNEAALNAVRQWVYTPTLLNGVPVSVVMTVTVNFQLK
jgi:protein TonB